MKKVMVFGSFDVLHPGHVYFLNEAKSYGDFLVVVIARDKTITEVKGKKPKYDEALRLESIKDLKPVDKAVLGNLEDKYEIIEKVKPDIICLGYDQEAFSENLKEKLEKKGLKPNIIRLRPYKEDIFKSSKLK